MPGTGTDPYNGIAIWGEDWPSAAKGRLAEEADPNLKRLFGILPRTGAVPRNDHFAPRVGLAWDPLGNGKMSVRAGFGIFYDRTSHDSIQNGARNLPFNTTAQINDGNIDNPAGGTSRVFPAAAYASQVTKTPRVYSYNFSIQRQLPGSVILDAGYVGTAGRNQARTLNLNQLPAGTRLNAPNCTINANALRPYPGYSAMTITDYGDTTNYNSMQITLSRRMAKGLSFGSAFTLSKTIDSSGGTFQDQYNPKSERGLSAIHRGKVLSANLQYDLPFFASVSSAFVRKGLGGWALSSVIAAQSGAPNSITVASDVARVGTSSSRASVAAGAKPSIDAGQRSVDHWFNTDAFLSVSAMTPGVFGNTGRNILIGPGMSSVDLAIMKNFAIREQAKLEFRAESFNLLNHASFSGVGTTVGTSTFGKVTASGPGRVLALGLKLRF